MKKAKGLKLENRFLCAARMEIFFSASEVEFREDDFDKLSALPNSATSVTSFHNLREGTLLSLNVNKSLMNQSNSDELPNPTHTLCLNM